MTNRRRLVRASEIGTYVYCQRAWWLRTVIGLTPDNHTRLHLGIAAHQRHGTRVRTARVLLFGSIVLFLAAVMLLII